MILSGDGLGMVMVLLSDYYVCDVVLLLKSRKGQDP